MTQHPGVMVEHGGQEKHFQANHKRKEPKKKRMVISVPELSQVP
jgi:hypothetical protein